MRDRREVRAVAHHGGEATRPGDRLGRAGDAGLREQRGRKSAARRAADTDALRHRAERLDQAGGLRRRVAERPDEMPCIEGQQLRDRRGGAEHAAGRRDVPAAPVVPGRDRIAEPAFDLDAEHEGVQQRRAGDRLRLGEREQRRRDRRGRMDDGRVMRVVEVEHVPARRVDECGAQHVEPVAPADHAGVARTGKTVEHRERAGDRGVAAAAKRGAEEVQDRTPGGMPDVVGHVLPPRRHEEIGERTGHASVLHRSILDAGRYHGARPRAFLHPLRAVCLGLTHVLAAPTTISSTRCPNLMQLSRR